MLLVVCTHLFFCDKLLTSQKILINVSHVRWRSETPTEDQVSDNMLIDYVCSTF
jgi:hypothetical protein